ncbi:MAG: LON peptidase substrate-binding domain-containing protein [Myxococcota bacterium]
MDRNEDGNGGGEKHIAALPLFPLPGTVFFPHTLLPLHVFEPRYRRMTEDVLAGDGLMAVVLQREEKDPGHLGDLHRVAGLGRVVHHERLPDGRFHILLQGIARVALLEELPREGLLYRRARAKVMPTKTTDGPRVTQEYETLRACYAQVMDRCPLARERLGELMRRVTDPGVLADVICASEIDDPCTRQGALEESDLALRLQRANEALAALLLGNLTPEDSLAH